MFCRLKILGAGTPSRTQRYRGHLRPGIGVPTNDFVFRVVTIFASSKKYRQLRSIAWLLTRGATSFYPWLQNFDTYGVTPSRRNELHFAKTYKAIITHCFSFQRKDSIFLSINILSCALSPTPHNLIIWLFDEKSLLLLTRLDFLRCSSSETSQENPDCS